MNTSHSGILEGTGSKESPFLVIETPFSNSARIQRETVERIYGAGTYPDTGGIVAAMAGVSMSTNAEKGQLVGRLYHEIPRGVPGNRDLCETVFYVDGRETRIWFDLSNVTKFETNPGTKSAREGLRDDKAKHPERTQRIQDEMLKVMGLPPKQRPKGCLGLLILILLAVVGLLLILR